MQGRIPADLPGKFKGHAYLLYAHGNRPVIGDGVMIIGDAAGLAYTQSGEGIRPAIESGLMAAANALAAESRLWSRAFVTTKPPCGARFGARGEGAGAGDASVEAPAGAGARTDANAVVRAQCRARPLVPARAAAGAVRKTATSPSTASCEPRHIFAMLEDVFAMLGELVAESLA